MNLVLKNQTSRPIVDCGKIKEKYIYSGILKICIEDLVMTEKYKLGRNAFSYLFCSKLKLIEFEYL